MATEPASLKQCANSDCKVAETGKCVEGLALDRCPHYGRPPSQPETPSTDAEPAVPAGIGLPSGDLLKIPDAGAILRGGQSRVVAIIGPRGAGKTTLITSLFELLQHGPIGNCHFARSTTLYAFERACHHSRAVSLRITPATERTILADVHFYHLGIRIDGGPILDLLLADRAGEDYRDATDNPSAARGFAEIARADSINLLVDGRRLTDLVSRQAVQSEIVMIMQALIDGGAVVGRPRIALILTKIDEVIASGHRDRVEQDFAALLERITRLFGGNFDSVDSFKVAACPSDDSMKRGFGVPALLDFWNTPAASPAPVTQSPLLSSRFMGRLSAAAE